VQEIISYRFILPRIFVAALLPDYIKKDISRILIDADKSFFGVKWEKASKVHITLKFIGSVNNETGEDVLSKVNGIAAKTTHINVSFSHIDAFPDFRKPRVLALRLKNSKELHDLNSLIEDELSVLGIKKEGRKFIPHITIGRIKNGFRVLDKSIKLNSTEFIIRDIGVIKSNLKKEGSEYINLGVYKLS